MIQNKKGVSTIEIIVSFTIFVAFVLFIMAYINPIKRDISNSLLVNLEAGVQKNAMSNLDEFPVVIKDHTAVCFTIQNPFAVSANLSARALDSSIIPHQISGSSISLANITNDIYIIMQSDEITQASTPGFPGGCSSPAYQPTVSRSEKLYSYKKLVIMNDSYYNKYSQLKEKLNYPLTSDFNIIISDTESNFSMNRTIPSNVKIKVLRYPIQILKNDLKKDASITFVVW